MRPKPDYAHVNPVKYYLLRLDPVYMNTWHIHYVGDSAAECLTIAVNENFRFFRIEDSPYYNRVHRANRDA